MNELRKNPITSEWVIIASNRAKRPHEWKLPKEPKKKRGICFFCPGNEDKTPPTILSIGNPWKVRIFENKFPALYPSIFKKNEKGIFVSATPHGYHEVIVETPKHDKQLHQLSSNEIKLIIDGYCHRIEDLYKKDGIEYVSIIKNHGYSGGVSLIHSHSQLMAYPIVPMKIKKEINSFKKYLIKKEKCIFCDILKSERRTSRHIISNQYFTAFCPWASKFPYEIWIIPKKHQSIMTKMNEVERFSFSEILKNVLSSLFKLFPNLSYNFVIHNKPKRTRDFHWHLEIYPRLSIPAGFEFGDNVWINIISPERAAGDLRNILKI